MGKDSRVLKVLSTQKILDLTAKHFSRMCCENVAVFNSHRQIPNVKLSFNGRAIVTDVGSAGL